MCRAGDIRRGRRHRAYWRTPPVCRARPTHTAPPVVEMDLKDQVPRPVWPVVVFGQAAVGIRHPVVVAGHRDLGGSPSGRAVARRRPVAQVRVVRNAPAADGVAEVDVPISRREGRSVPLRTSGGIRTVEHVRPLGVVQKLYGPGVVPVAVRGVAPVIGDVAKPRHGDSVQLVGTLGLSGLSNGPAPKGHQGRSPGSR